MRKKTLLRAAMTGLGFLALRWRLLPYGVYGFAFHRIGNPASTEYSRNVFSCTAERLEQVVTFLKERFEIIGLDQLHGLVYSGSPPTDGTPCSRSTMVTWTTTPSRSLC